MLLKILIAFYKIEVFQNIKNIKKGEEEKDDSILFYKFNANEFEKKLFQNKELLRMTIGKEDGAILRSLASLLLTNLMRKKSYK